MPRPKFQVQKQTMDFQRKIRRVVDETTCHRHNSIEGEPCWRVPFGVCNQRATKIFDGVPTERTKSTARAAFRAQKEHA